MKRLFSLLLLAPSLALAQSAAYNLSQLAHGLESGGIVPCAFGGTGLTSAPTNGYVLVGNGTCYAVGQLDLTLGVKNILPVANGGTGTATPGIVAGTNVTVTGTWPNQTVNSSGGGTPGGTNGQVQFNNSGAFGGFSLGTGVQTWLQTPTLASLNTAISAILASISGAITTGDLTSWTDATHVGDAGVALSALPTLAGTNTFSGTNTFAGIVDSGITAGTSPICPNGTSGAFTTVGCSGGGMVYPGAGVPNSTGSAWGPSYTLTGLQSALISSNAKTYTPTLASGATNDWDPTAGSIATLGFAYTTPNSAGSTVDGILAGNDQQLFTLCNEAALGSSNSWILLENQSASDSTAANRLLGAGNVVLAPQQCIDLLYSSTESRWIMGAVANAGVGAMDAQTSATSITPDCSFWANKITASATGTFTINAPTDCTPQPEQRMLLEIISPSGGTVTYSWNAAYVASATVALPTTSNAASKEDDFILYYSASKSAWKVEAFNQGF